MTKFDSNSLGSFKDDIYKALVTMERSLVKADNEMQTIMNFVDKYIPMKQQQYITTFLEAVFDDSRSGERQRMDVFSRNRFEQLHDAILSD